MIKIDRLILILLMIFFVSSILNSEFNLSSDTELFYNVSLSGAVSNPGVFVVPPSTRVSSIIKLSEIEFLEAAKIQAKVELPAKELKENRKKYEKYYPVEKEANEQLIQGSLRNIILKRGEAVIKVDLLKFFLLGDTKNNPYVMDGDIIIVPSKTGSVNIFGAVNREGEIEHSVSDKISDIIDLAMGTKPEALLDRIEIIRFTDDKKTEEIKVDLAKIILDPACSDNISLKLDDRIYVRTKLDFHKKTNVTVSGEVQYPGTFAIEEGKTTLLEILQQCGNFTAKADLYNSFVQRLEGIEDADPEFERLKLMVAANMNKLEYAYFKNTVRELKGKYSIDMPALLNEDKVSNNLILRNGDFIVIPQKSMFINVTGQVLEPGLIAYEAGKTFNYYIEQSGGYNWNAKKSKVRLIKANTGKWIKPNKETIVMEGDTIFIPEKPEFDTWQFTLDSLKIVSAIATILITINTLTAAN